ncbi:MULTISPECIES: hypothetical protein [Bacillaceae]|uniref:Uncharacterized protein n=1 Tax=Alkalicoccobacillus plakortidis TaxID=444060 RepID=A0A9D5DQP5_9BACI|nr:MULTISPECIES: hypothetical protein [Bacillaceae]KQL58302.1 hypothetical protein AN965_04385 [Alkalicoccobacillus plakortidis]
MSSNYWDEAKSMLLDDKALNDVLKFHQNTTRITDINSVLGKDEIRSTWIEEKRGRVIHADTFLKRYSFDELHESLWHITNVLKHYIDTDSLNFTLPVLGVFKDQFELETGFYTFDFENRYLVKYQEIDDSVELLQPIRREFHLSLSFFLSIEEAVFILGRQGYRDGLVQIGEWFGKVTSHLTLVHWLRTIFIPDQPWTYVLGLNLRKQFHIKTIFIGEKK